MIDRILDLLSAGYAWAAAQPLFIQIPLGIALFFGGLYVLAWSLGLAFLTLLRIRDMLDRDGSSR